ASVGDSICFRMRSGTLEQLSEEHTLLRDLLETTPYFDDAAAARLPRNVITRALGMNEALRVSIRSVDLSHGDRFILVSDGVSDVLNDEAIVEIMQTTRNAEEHARTLISSALEHGADDNCAVVVACVETPLGVTAIPKAHHARPIRTDRKNRDSMAPEPEIVIVEEDFPEDRWDTEVHVIPPLAEDMISDLKAYARAQKTRKTERPPPFRKT
ncbi:MAG: SpoIIE family protein phosphatase, partial [Deltaproteobacteria bacterium]|nr:SpoIIE family protein phosphatase [Deltaproteobacteria bacterium]